jgi:hypothetical protein
MAGIYCFTSAGWLRQQWRTILIVAMVLFRMIMLEGDTYGLRLGPQQVPLAVTYHSATGPVQACETAVS